MAPGPSGERAVGGAYRRGTLSPVPPGEGRCLPQLLCSAQTASGLSQRQPRAWRVQERTPCREGSLRLEKQFRMAV